MLICKSMIIFLFHNRFIIKLKGSDISENVKRGHLKMISFVKTVKKLAKTIRTNFYRTVEMNQMLSGV